MSRMTNDEFVGRLIAFRDEDEYIPETNVLMEVTEVSDGSVEVAFNFPSKAKERIYVSIPIGELIERIAEFHQPKK